MGIAIDEYDGKEWKERASGLDYPEAVRQVRLMQASSVPIQGVGDGARFRLRAEPRKWPDGYKHSYRVIEPTPPPVPFAKRIWDSLMGWVYLFGFVVAALGALALLSFVLPSSCTKALGDSTFESARSVGRGR